MEIEIDCKCDEETIELIKDQLYFDEIGLGINGEELVMFYLLEIFNIN